MDRRTDRPTLRDNQNSDRPTDRPKPRDNQNSENFEVTYITIFLKTNKMHQLKYSKDIIKHTQYQAPTPTCFGTKLPSSGSLPTKYICSFNKHFRRSSSLLPSQITSLNMSKLHTAHQHAARQRQVFSVYFVVVRIFTARGSHICPLILPITVVLR